MSLKWLSCGAILALSACASTQSSSTSGDPLRSYDPDRVDVPSGTIGFSALYRQMGLAASPPPISFVARMGSFATQTPDTSIALVGLSVPNRGLTFRHVADGNAASYVVELSLEANGVMVQQTRDSESVRVPTAREIARSDESVIYRRTFRVPPGEYSFRSRVLDVGGARQAEQTITVVVPRFSRPSVSTPIPAYEGSPRAGLRAIPTFLPSPRGAFVFGVDDSVGVYLESYGQGAPVRLELRDQRDSLAWSGTVALSSGESGALASGIVRVPVGRADMGVLTLRATRSGWADTTHAALFLGFGPDLPVVSFGQMLSYLRFFAPPDKLNALRKASPSQRGETWAAFLRSTDPDPATSRNEALDDYFVRIRDANESFRGDPRGGWLSDRGMVYVGLGQPSAAYEQYGYLGGVTGDITGRSDGRARLLIWEYQDLQARIIFYDQLESGSWRMTQQSESIFRSLLYRKLR